MVRDTGFEPVTPPCQIMSQQKTLTDYIHIFHRNVSIRGIKQTYLQRG